jgi:DNA end-binding protein Ku
LHQVWRPPPAEEPEAQLPDRPREEPAGARAALPDTESSYEADQTAPARRIVTRPHDPRTGEEIEKSEVVKGYEYSRGQFVTFTREELKALDVESSRVIDLDTFVPRAGIDPLYFDTPYYLYPDGPIAIEAIHMIGAAMEEAGVAGIGRLSLSRRERMVMIEPHGTGMVLFTLRTADEVRASQFVSTEGDLDPEMVAIAGAIIRQRLGKFDPSAFRDRYQEALRQLVEAKMKGLPVKPGPVPEPAPVVDLMSALKRSLAKETASANRTGGGRETRPGAAPDRRQAELLLPLRGRQKIRSERPAQASRPRRKA